MPVVLKKKTIHKIKEEKKEAKKEAKKEKYFEAVGRRKTSIARVRIYSQKGEISVNGKDYFKYFPILRLHKTVIAPISEMKVADKISVSVKVKGGGMSSQAGAIRMGIARALSLYNPDFRKRLRKVGYLTRDARAVERKKYGLKKARRAPQWNKR